METEDIAMKFYRRTILSSILILALSQLGAIDKLVKKDHFLSLNPNIKNEKLKSEMEQLKQDFDFGNQKIQKYYTMEINKLKEELHLEVNALKKEFEGKQKVLLQKFDKDSKIKHSNSDLLNRSDKKRKKEKRPVQKPK